VMCEMTYEVFCVRGRLGGGVCGAIGMCCFAG